MLKCKWRTSSWEACRFSTLIECAHRSFTLRKSTSNCSKCNLVGKEKALGAGLGGLADCVLDGGGGCVGCGGGACKVHELTSPAVVVEGTLVVSRVS